MSPRIPLRDCFYAHQLADPGGPDGDLASFETQTKAVWICYAYLSGGPEKCPRPGGRFEASPFVARAQWKRREASAAALAGGRANGLTITGCSMCELDRAVLFCRACALRWRNRALAHVPSAQGFNTLRGCDGRNCGHGQDDTCVRLVRGEHFPDFHPDHVAATASGGGQFVCNRHPDDGPFYCLISTLGTGNGTGCRKCSKRSRGRKPVRCLGETAHRDSVVGLTGQPDSLAEALACGEKSGVAVDWRCARCNEIFSRQPRCRGTGLCGNCRGNVSLCETTIAEFLRISLPSAASLATQVKISGLRGAFDIGVSIEGALSLFIEVDGHFSHNRRARQDMAKTETALAHGHVLRVRDLGLPTLAPTYKGPRRYVEIAAPARLVGITGALAALPAIRMALSNLGIACGELTDDQQQAAARRAAQRGGYPEQSLADVMDTLGCIKVIRWPAGKENQPERVSQSGQDARNLKACWICRACGQPFEASLSKCLEKQDCGCVETARGGHLRKHPDLEVLIDTKGARNLTRPTKAVHALRRTAKDRCLLPCMIDACPAVRRSTIGAWCKLPLCRTHLRDELARRQADAKWRASIERNGSALDHIHGSELRDAVARDLLMVVRRLPSGAVETVADGLAAVPRRARTASVVRRAPDGTGGYMVTVNNYMTCVLRGTTPRPTRADVPALRLSKADLRQLRRNGRRPTRRGLAPQSQLSVVCGDARIPSQRGPSEARVAPDSPPTTGTVVL